MASEGEYLYDIGLRMVAHSQSTGTVIVGQRALFREGVAALLRHTPYKVIASAQRSFVCRGSKSEILFRPHYETRAALGACLVLSVHFARQLSRPTRTRAI